MATSISKVSAIIVNYRSAEHAITCVHSLLEQQDVNLEILVVDNASGDDSVARIRTTHPSIKLIENPNNDGFAKANNLAASMATGDFILVINPDIRLLGVDAIARLSTYLVQHPEIGVLGPDILESRRNKRVLPKRYYPAQSKLRQTAALSGLPGDIAWILGACMMFRAEVYRQVGGFDSDFFLYGEDTDICLRLRQAGYAVACLHAVQVDHWGGASESGSRFYDTRYRKKRGFYQFCLKHYTPRDAARLLRRAYLESALRLWGLKFCAWFCFGKMHRKLARSIDRNQPECNVIRAILQERKLTI